MQPQTIVVPKVDSADDMDWLFDHVYTTVEQTREEADIVDLLTQVESPMGLLNLRYGNFDIILDLFSRICQLHPTPHAPCATPYLVPDADRLLIGACNPML